MASVSSSISYSRILQEGYGPGAWHGADIKAAVADVSAADAFRRPGPSTGSGLRPSTGSGPRPSTGSGLRHNIAEIAVHHAYYVHSVRGRLSPVKVEPFPLEGDDWFALDGRSGLTWDQARELLDTQYAKLASLIADIDAGTVKAKKDDAGVLELVLGITCHSAYHAGQMQLTKALA